MGRTVERLKNKASEACLWGSGAPGAGGFKDSAKHRDPVRSLTERRGMLQTETRERPPRTARLAADSPTDCGGPNLSGKLDIMRFCKSRRSSAQGNPWVGNDKIYYVPFSATRIHRKVKASPSPRQSGGSGWKWAIGKVHRQGRLPVLALNRVTPID
jgi:hypothetical protein